jgi:RimJ/RimL family protein N-acetyltransferase
MYSLTKKLARFLFGEYSAYHVYAFSAGNCRALASHDTDFRFASLERAQLEASGDPSIAEHANYHGPETYAYACFEDTRIVAVCYFWYGAQYRKRNFWPLGDSEAKLVQVFTVADMRDRGIATHLIAYAADDMLRKGFQRLYARIWHSNKASLKPFQRAGWGRVATVVEIYPLRRRLPYRLTFRLQAA